MQPYLIGHFGNPGLKTGFRNNFCSFDFCSFSYSGQSQEKGIQEIYLIMVPKRNNNDAYGKNSQS